MLITFDNKLGFSFWPTQKSSIYIYISYFYIVNAHFLFTQQPRHVLIFKVFKTEQPLHLFFFFFFLTTKGYYINQTWGGMGNQTGIKQPTKWSFLWNDLAVLAKESEIRFCTRGIWVILKSRKHICRVSILFNSVAKLGQARGSLIIAIKSLQSIPKLRHVEYCSMLSIPHLSASSSECRGNSSRM